MPLSSERMRGTWLVASQSLNGGSFAPFTVSGSPSHFPAASTGENGIPSMTNARSRVWKNAFTASTFPECISGRWLTMDAGDLDGDGDDDLVLGSLVKVPTPVPDFLKKTWDEQGPSVLILKNKLRRPLPKSP